MIFFHRKNFYAFFVGFPFRFMEIEIGKCFPNKYLDKMKKWKEKKFWFSHLNLFEMIWSISLRINWPIPMKINYIKCFLKWNYQTPNSKFIINPYLIFHINAWIFKQVYGLWVVFTSFWKHRMSISWIEYFFKYNFI